MIFNAGLFNSHNRCHVLHCLYVRSVDAVAGIVASRAPAIELDIGADLGIWRAVTGV